MKLRNRKQLPDESGMDEITDLCRMVDPAMPEAAKLDYLFSGMKPSLLEKVWIKTQTCVQLLAKIKLHTTAAGMASQTE